MAGTQRRIALEFGMKLLAAAQMGGEAVYHSYLIVPADSPATSMADLRGKVFAFTDPMSNTGRLYPTYLVQQLGESPQTFFRRTFFTYSHDDAIRAVYQGERSFIPATPKFCWTTWWIATKRRAANQSVKRKSATSR